MVAALTVAMLAVTGPVAGATGLSAGSFGPLPSGLPIESRCQGLHVGSHIVFPGQDVVAHTSGGICGGAPKDISWVWDVPQGVSGTRGCAKDGTYCAFKAGAPTNAYVPVCIYGGNVQGAWESCDYYAVAGAGQGVIDGYVTNKDGSPTVGTDIAAYGVHGATTATDANGWFALQVAPGRYTVRPSGGPKASRRRATRPRSLLSPSRGGRRPKPTSCSMLGSSSSSA